MCVCVRVVLDMNATEIRKLTHLAGRKRKSLHTMQGYYAFLLVESLAFFDLLRRHGRLASLTPAQLGRLVGFSMYATYLFRLLCRSSVLGRLGLRQCRRALIKGAATDPVVITFDTAKTDGQGALYFNFLPPVRAVWRAYLDQVRPALIARGLFVGDKKLFFPSNAAANLRLLFKPSALPTDLTLAQIRHQGCRHISELAHSGSSHYSAQVLSQLQIAAGHGKDATCVDKAYLLNIKLQREVILCGFIIDQYLAPAARKLREALDFPTDDVPALGAPFDFQYTGLPDEGKTLSSTALAGRASDKLTPIRARVRKRSQQATSSPRTKKARVDEARRCLNRSSNSRLVRLDVCTPRDVC